MTDVTPRKNTVDGEVDLYAETTMFGVPVVELFADTSLDVSAETAEKVPTPPPWRQTGAPRHASIAAASSAQQHRAAARRAASSIAARNRLPRTQVDFYAQRLTRR